jgi:hypothetical protein
MDEDKSGGQTWPWIWLALFAALAAVVLALPARHGEISPPLVLFIICWFFSGIPALIQGSALKESIGTELPGVLEEYRVGSLWWTQNNRRLLRATFDSRVRSKPALRAQSIRLRALAAAQLGGFVVLALVIVVKGA